ncbi:MAG TPA: type II secretion system protein [Gemmatimonadaceae bacterium]|jgi:prepilin-type N-terminal cleavage/methylation domain-containing protein
MRRRAGFTLIETIVTVGILAVLAAFVVPTVIQKAGVGDPVKVQNDLNTFRTGLETFATDSKAGFPQLLNSLTDAPTSGTNRLIDSTKMSDGQISKWNGPYIGSTISRTTKDSIPTGYTAYVMNFVHRFDIADNVPEHDSTGAVNASFVSTGSLFSAVEIHGLTLAQATALNALIDGAGDINVASDSSNITGRLRFTAPVSGQIKQAYYLASPITP